MEQNNNGKEESILLAKSAECSVYQLRNHTGEGTMTIYDVFPGVMLAYNDMHLQYYDSEFHPDQEIFCIDHCREGRMEYISAHNAFSYVGVNDVKLDRRMTHTGRFDFPLAHYHGVTISFELEKAVAFFKKNQTEYPVDFSNLLRKFEMGKYPRVLHGVEALDRIFEELYQVPEKIRLPYYKIKIVELLLCMEAMEVPKEQEKSPYFYKTKVEKVKAIQKYLLCQPDKNYTQAELAQIFDLSLTSMKQCFRSVFGMPMGVWLMQYRMNLAAEYLQQERNTSIAEIAGRVGYDSPSKFAAAFRKVMGMAPLEYRKRIR